MSAETSYQLKRGDADDHDRKLTIKAETAIKRAACNVLGDGTKIKGATECQAFASALVNVTADLLMQYEDPRAIARTAADGLVALVDKLVSERGH